MAICAIWHNLLGSKPRNSTMRRPSPRFQPRLEVLEDRRVPATLTVGSGRAFAHIQDAVNAARPGDTILVAPGTYAEQIGIGMGKDNLRLVAQGTGAENVVIAAPSTGSGALVDIAAQGVVVQGFQLNGLNQSNIFYGINIHRGGSASIVHNHITHLQGGDGIYAVTTGDVSILDNRIDDYNKDGILVKGGAKVIIEHNVVVGAGPVGTVAQNGIQIGDDSSEQVASALVVYNLVSGNVYTNSATDGFEAAGILVINQFNRVRVSHNSVTHNQDGIFLASVSNALLDYNDSRCNTADGILLLDSFCNSVSQNDAFGNGRNGIQLNGIDATPGGRSTVYGNVIDHNVCVGNGLDGISLQNADDNRVGNNLAAFNARYGIALLVGDDGGLSTGNVGLHNETTKNGKKTNSSNSFGDNVD
jgi:parallel beta-helix repeat protein